LWAAKSAMLLEGDFVECGVGKGFMSSGLLESLNWNGSGKAFYLFDTFTGIDENYLTDKEKTLFGDIEHFNQISARDGAYCDNFERVTQNFAEWENIHLIKGPVPETLSQFQSSKIAYLHIDMNCVIPEIAAMDHFWPKVVPGGFV